MAGEAIGAKDRKVAARHPPCPCPSAQLEGQDVNGSRKPWALLELKNMNRKEERPCALLELSLP